MTQGELLPPPFGIPRHRLVKYQKRIALTLAITAWLTIPAWLLTPADYSITVRVIGAILSWIVVMWLAWRTYPYNPALRMLELVLKHS